jgi:acid phosphatase type 7
VPLTRPGAPPIHRPRTRPLAKRIAGATVVALLAVSVVPGVAAASRRGPRNVIIAAAGDISPADPRQQDDDVARMIRTRIDPDAVLVLGDAQYESGSLAEFQQYYAAGWGLHDLMRITYPVPGNHEYDVGAGETADDPAAGYFGYFRGRAAVNPNGVRPRGGFYSFDLGAWHLVALNSKSGAPLSKPQLRWFKRDLSKDGKRCELAFLHHPRWSSGAEHGSDADMQRAWSIAVKGGVDVVLAGHEHVYERFQRKGENGRPISNRSRANGAREFVVGTGGKGGNDGFGPAVAGSQRRVPAAGEASVFGALRMRLQPEAYRWAMLDETGAVLDAGGPVECRG